MLRFFPLANPRSKFVETINPDSEEYLMTYEDSFIAELKFLYPEDEELHRNLDTGQAAAIGNFLEKEAKMKLTTQQAIDLLAEGRQLELMLELQWMKRIERLCKKWAAHMGNYTAFSS